MPELPEVETIVRNHRPRLVGQRIARYTSSWPKNSLPSLAHVRRGLTGRTILDVTRRGKFIVMGLDDGAHLLVHLRMSGRFEWQVDHNPLPQHVRSTWEFDGGGRLLFCDARKFGRVTLTRDLDAATAALGPEPLSRGFTAEVLGDILRRRKRQIKPLLLDQTMIAGLGNIYTDEALFRAGLYPARRSDGLSSEQVRRLHAAIRQVLRLAIRNHGTSIDWIYPGGWMQKRLMVYGRTGEPCRTCGTPIVTFRVAQRGTYVCPRCQPRPRTGGRRGRR